MIFLKQLLRRIQDCGIVALPWLKHWGITKQHIRKYEKSGWIYAIGKGVFAREGISISWEMGLHVLQFHLDKKIHLGGKSALICKGLGHYVQVEEKKIYIFSEPRVVVDKWFIQYDWKISPRIIHSSSLPTDIGLEEEKKEGVTILISSPERAMLEMLCFTPTFFSFDESFHMMEGLSWLRPDLVQTLLEQCSSIKGKRIFLFLGDFFKHPWMERLQIEKIDLGSGKRSLVKGGYYDKKYMITVPQSFKEKIDESPLF